MSLETAAAPHPDDTIVAVSSAPGPGRRAIVRVGGPNARAVIAAVFAADAEAVPARHLVPGSVRLSGVHSPLPADLLFFAGPRSYTGQDLAELHTIGSPPLVERLVADLLAAGGRPARPGEFTLRAFLAGKTDLPRAEAVHAVVAAGTDADLSAALAQLAGGLSTPLDRLRDDLLNLLADVEAGLDFADEDITFVAKPDILARLTAAADTLTAVDRQLDDRGVSGRPLRVVLAGRPNAGKSSLFNALGGGPAALVSPEAGTTRDYLVKRIALNGVAVELVDTAGRQSPTSAIDAAAQTLGRAAADRADLVLWCVPAGEPFGDAGFDADVVRVRTKRDTRPGPPEHGVVACSAVTPGGTTELTAVLTARAEGFARPPLAPSQSRCRHHVGAARAAVAEARDLTATDGPAEFVAAALRTALDQLGEMVGAVFTPDLLDRIFSRFCIGK